MMRGMRQKGEPIFWFKVHGSGMQRAGEPDLSITYHGQSVKAELKQPGKKPTSLQIRRLEQYRDAGAIAGVVTNTDELASLLDQARKRGGG